METLGSHGSTSTAGTPIGYPSPTNLATPIQRRQSGDDEPLSDNEFSRDGDSPDALARVPESDVDPETLDKLRRQEREEREEIERELKAQSLSLSQADNNGNNTGSGLSLKDPPPIGLAGLEAFRREYLTSPLSHLRSSLPHNFPPLLPHTSSVMASIAESSFGKIPPSAPPSASSTGSNTPPALGLDRGMAPQSPSHRSPSSEFTSQQNWSFEEQFKQLYELSDCAKRKDFLDDLFAFMQKRGTPINRLPIMAKQVLDLYELYNLVIARGGLVEVINKKQWQEIIKGLNLPSSITSAAFTLRTQYTKYLYPYECHMKNLSSPNELQQAIDGNRREGRRSGYDSYPHMFPGPRPTMPLPPTSLSLPPMSPLPPGMRPHSFNGGFPGNISSSFADVLGGKSPPPGLNHGNPLSALEMTRLALFKMYNQAGLPPPPMRELPVPPSGLAGLDMGRAMAEQQARALQAVREVEECRREKERNEQEQNRAAAAAAAAVAAAREFEKEREHHHKDNTSRKGKGSLENNHHGHHHHHNDRDDDSAHSPPPMKRERRDSIEDSRRNGSPMGGANIRISSRGDSGDSSLVVTLEINSVMYQGVLFAQPKNNTNSNNSHPKEAKANKIS